MHQFISFMGGIFILLSSFSLSAQRIDTTYNQQFDTYTITKLIATKDSSVCKGGVYLATTYNKQRQKVSDYTYCSDKRIPIHTIVYYPEGGVKQQFYAQPDSAWVLKSYTKKGKLIELNAVVNHAEISDKKVWYLVNYYTNGNKRKETWETFVKNSADAYKQFGGYAGIWNEDLYKIYLYSHDGLIKEKSYRPNGQVYQETITVNKMPYYVHTFYDEQGQIDTTQKLVSGKFTGLKCEYNQDGLLVHRTMYKDGAVNGINETWFDNGKKSFTGYLIGDYSRRGMQTQYNPDGSVGYKELFNNTGASLYIISFHPNGKLNTIGSTSSERGLTFRYDDKGQLKYIITGSNEFGFDMANKANYNGTPTKNEGEWKNGVMDGEWKGYYPNGKLCYTCHFKDSLLNGTFKLYDPQGQVRIERTYKNGLVLPGSIKYTADNKPSIIFEKKPYGKIDTIEVSYFPNGGINRKALLVKDVHVETIEERNEQGKITMQVVDDTIKQQKITRYYNLNGTVATAYMNPFGKDYSDQDNYDPQTGRLVRSSRHERGIKDEENITTYYSSGEMESQATLVNKLLYHLYKVYRKDGSIQMKAAYHDGYRNGKTIYYKPDGSIERIDNYEKGKYIMLADTSTQKAACSCATIEEPIPANHFMQLFENYYSPSQLLNQYTHRFKLDSVFDHLFVLKSNMYNGNDVFSLVAFDTLNVLLDGAMKLELTPCKIPQSHVNIELGVNRPQHSELPYEDSLQSELPTYFQDPYRCYKLLTYHIANNSKWPYDDYLNGEIDYGIKRYIDGTPNVYPATVVVFAMLESPQYRNKLVTLPFMQRYLPLLKQAIRPQALWEIKDSLLYVINSAIIKSKDPYKTSSMWCRTMYKNVLESALKPPHTWAVLDRFFSPCRMNDYVSVKTSEIIKEYQQDVTINIYKMSNMGIVFPSNLLRQHQTNTSEKPIGARFLIRFKSEKYEPNIEYSLLDDEKLLVRKPESICAKDVEIGGTGVELQNIQLEMAFAGLGRQDGYYPFHQIIEPKTDGMEPIRFKNDRYIDTFKGVHLTRGTTMILPMKDGSKLSLKMKNMIISASEINGDIEVEEKQNVDISERLTELGFKVKDKLEHSSNIYFQFK